MKPMDIGALAAVILIWSSNFVAGKIGLMHFSPMFMLALRFSLVTVLLAPFLFRPGAPLGKLFQLSVMLGGLHYSLIFTGLNGIDAGPAAIASQLYVPFAALLAWVFFSERLGLAQAFGMAVAFAGVYILGGEPDIRPRPLPLLMVVGAAFTLAIATIQIKSLGPINILALNAWVALFSTPQLFLLSWLFEAGQGEALGNADWRGWAVIAFMGVGVTIGGHSLWYYLVRRYPVTIVTPPTLLIPVLAVIFAVVLLDEPLSSRMLIGGAITIAGVAVVQLRRPVAASGE